MAVVKILKNTQSDVAPPAGIASRSAELEIYGSSSEPATRGSIP